MDGKGDSLLSICSFWSLFLEPEPTSLSRMAEGCPFPLTLEDSRSFVTWKAIRSPSALDP